MSKYTPLKLHLQSQLTGEVTMSFDEVEAVLGFRLPNSAYRHRPWWANESKGHVHAQAWLDAGSSLRKSIWRAASSFSAGIILPAAVSVARRGEQAVAAGMSEAARGFEQEDKMTANRHPAWGALKGTFTIAPGTDLTAPMFSDEEWGEIEREMEADWDQIAEGMPARKA